MTSDITTLMKVVALLIPGSVAAFEAEPSVPLSVGAVLGKATVHKVGLRLSGREVEVVTTLHNANARAQHVGFYARTPFFQQFGDGEMHSNKSFSDLAVTFGGKTIAAPGANRRGFFMGRDITHALRRAGLGPLPDRSVSEKKLARVRFPHGLKADVWEGYVSYAWTQSVPPKSSAVSTVRYQALPQFEPAAISSDQFRQAVSAHCGDPAALSAELIKLSDGADHVMLEVYELPVRFMQMQDVTVSIRQPTTNWLQTRPVKSLVCGLAQSESGATRSGVIEGAGTQLSVLVISLASQTAPVVANGN